MIGIGFVGTVIPLPEFIPPVETDYQKLLNTLLNLRIDAIVSSRTTPEYWFKDKTGEVLHITSIGNDSVTVERC